MKIIHFSITNEATGEVERRSLPEDKFLEYVKDMEPECSCFTAGPHTCTACNEDNNRSN